MTADFDPRTYIDSVEWVFAKTMPDHPHWYTVRRKGDTWDHDFDAMVNHVRTHGTRKPWRPNPDAKASYYTYCRIDAHEYWTMGWPVRETTIINRREAAPAE